MSPRPGSLADRLSSTTCVLVVEDEPDIAALLGAFFRASGLGLVHVNPAAVDDVVDAVVEHTPSCVLLDINLAGLSGIDVLAALRAHPPSRSLPVVVVTADSRPTTRQQATDLGVSAYVQKPFSVSDLFDQVAALAASGLVTGMGAEDTPHLLAGYLERAERIGVPLSFVLVRAGDGDDAVLTALEEGLPGDAVLGSGEGGEVSAIVPGLDAAATTTAVARVLTTCGPAVRAGVAAAPAHASTADELYMAADAALAEAVERGETVVAAR